MKKFLISVFILILAGIFFYFNPSIFNADFWNKYKNLDIGGFNKIENLKNEVFLPDPLISKIETKNSYLTQEGILKETNFYRLQNGLKLLVADEELNKIATLRMKDMFEKQYFTHFSKEGIGAPEIAKNIGYEYIAIGENIALGNFANDKELVLAWMNSPSHRENILNKNYSRIGISVGRNYFYDEQTQKKIETWIAVQVFARPSSDCPPPDKVLEKNINNLKAEIEMLKIEADNIKTYLEQNKPSFNREEIMAYNEKVNYYNNLAKQINQKIADLKDLILKYNAQVKIFNECANN